MGKNEEVLCIPKSVLVNKILDNYTVRKITMDTIDLNDFYYLINVHGSFVSRLVCEEVESNLIQIIPYNIVIRANKDLNNELGTFNKEIFVYERLKGGSESRLHNKQSIGIGGHINQVDNQINDSRSYSDQLASSVQRCSIRELTEELTSPIDKYICMPISKDNRINLIYSDENNVSKVHLGVVKTYFYFGEDELRPKERDKISGKFVPFDTLYPECKLTNLETWSQIVISTGNYMNKLLYFNL